MPDRTMTPPARPRDRGDRWRVAAEWAVAIAAIPAAAVIGGGVLLATIEGGVTWLGLSPVQALALAGLLGFVVLPGTLLALHQLRPILRDRQPDDVEQHTRDVGMLRDASEVDYDQLASLRERWGR